MRSDTPSPSGTGRSATSDILCRPTAPVEFRLRKRKTAPAKRELPGARPNERNPRLAVPTVAPSAASQIAALLDSDEISVLVAELDELRWTGRKGYGARTLLGACLVRSLYAIPSWTRTTRLIAEHAALRDVLGGTPS